MPRNSVHHHICEAWQPENYVPVTIPSSPGNEFLIEIYVNFMSMVGGARVDEFTQEDDFIMSPTMYKTFRQRCEHITKDTTSWSTVSNMLSQVGVPYHVQPFMIGKISEAARSIASASENHSFRTLPMVVSIRVVLSLDEESWFSEDPSGSFCVKGLEKVRIGKDYVDGDKTVEDHRCVICLEEIRVGSEAVSMPCLHYYHGDCILNWLQRSSLCPLCRFQMPQSR